MACGVCVQSTEVSGTMQLKVPWLWLQVLPSAYGQVLPPWFFLQRSYWRSGSQPGNSESADHQGQAADGSVASLAAPYIQIVGLRKVFHTPGGGERVAVDGLSLNMSAGRISALLGHNGQCCSSGVRVRAMKIFNCCFISGLTAAGCALAVVWRGRGVQPFMCASLSVQSAVAVLRLQVPARPQPSTC